MVSLLWREKYKNDMKSGEWRDYYSNGKLKDVTTYKLFKKKSKFNDNILSKRVVWESRMNGLHQSYSARDYKLTESGELQEWRKAW